MKHVVKLAALAAMTTLSLAAQQSQAVVLTHESSINGSNEAGSVDYFQFSTDASDLVTLETFSDDFDTVLWLFRDNGGAITSNDFVAVDDDSGTVSNSAYGFKNSLLSLSLEAGSYITAVGDFLLTEAEAISGINDSSSLGNGYGDYVLQISGIVNNSGSVGGGSGGDNNSGNPGSGDNGSNNGGGDGSNNGGSTPPNGGGSTPPAVDVPEPMTLSLLGLAMAGLGAARRKKKV